MIRHKIDGEHTVMFNSRTGFKMRVGPDNSVYTKASTPELVDVKITDKCPYKCSFCYQASLPDGQHATFESIKNIASALGELGVFEVAIGGGEPVEHPDFPKILETFSENGIVPNFTCFGTNWISDTDIFEAVSRHVGGIGVSVHTAKQINKVIKIQDAFASSGRVSVMAQHVFGTESYENTLEIVERADHVLFLGYKTVGFGNRFQPNKFNQTQVATILSKAKKLSVDTAFVDSYHHVIREMGIAEELMASPEGKFSCYIDAVTGEIGPSSYGGDGSMSEINCGDSEAIKTEFASY